MDIISIHSFTPLFLLLQLNLTFMKRILHLVSLKDIIFKSSHNWFKYWHSCDQILIKIPFLILYDARKLSSLISSWRKRLTRCRVVGIKIALSYFSNTLICNFEPMLMFFFSIFIDFICTSTYVTRCTVCLIQYSKSTDLI